MDTNDLQSAYEARRADFGRAAKNVREAIELFLANANVQPLTVVSRVKSFASFAEKLQRKSYSSPFDQTTDFVGIRIILYTPKEIHSVAELLQREFEILERDDKSSHLEANEFGYRSQHLIARIPAEWAKTPNYRGLERISFEIQIRTVMMHAWAEIEHKLQYKSKEQVPRELQRRLFLLAAKVEEADGQFESLVAEVGAYRHAIAEKVAKAGAFDTTLDLNLDTFKELISFFYPAKKPHNAIAGNLFAEVIDRAVTLPSIVKAATDFKPLEPLLEANLTGALSAPGYLGYALDVFIDGFWRPKSYSKSRNRIISNLRAKLKTS